MQPMTHINLCSFLINSQSSLSRFCVFHDDLRLLSLKVQRFIRRKAELMHPRGIYICDGSQSKANEFMKKTSRVRYVSAVESIRK